MTTEHEISFGSPTRRDGDIREQIKRTGSAHLLAQYDAGKITQWPPLPPPAPSTPTHSTFDYEETEGQWGFILILTVGMVTAFVIGIIAGVSL